MKNDEILKKTTETVIVNKQGWSFFSALALLLVFLKYGMNDDINGWWIIAAIFGPLLIFGLILAAFFAFILVCFIVALLVEFVPEVYTYYKVKRNEKTRNKEREELRKRQEYLKNNSKYEE